MTAPVEPSAVPAAAAPTLFADPLIPTASCQLVAQGAEAVSPMGGGEKLGVD